MSKTIVITLNNSGTDAGPYNLTLIDGLGNATAWTSNPVTKAQLTAGYQMIVPDATVKVKVKSRTCTSYVELVIPTTQCPCHTITFAGTRGSTTTFTFYKCGENTLTSLTVGAIGVSLCVNRFRPITVTGTGSYYDTNICCTS